MSLGILILRVAVGLTMAAHGAQKMFGWFEGPGFAGVADMMRKMGFRVPRVNAALLTLAEMGGGLLLASGFLTPFGVAAVVGAMIGAITLVHWKNGFFSTRGGYEFNLLLIAASTTIALTGPGPYSLDGLLSWNLYGPRWALVSLLGGLAVWAAVLATRRPPALSAMGRQQEEPRQSADRVRTDAAA